jgi:hypothetical protein
VRARIEAALGRRWRAELFGTVRTSLTRHALAGDPDETMVVARLGARYTERAPHLSVPGFSWCERESYFYVAVAVAARASLLAVGPSRER